MPIYEQKYRKHEGRAPLNAVRFWPITREALLLLRPRWALLVMSFGVWIPAIVWTVLLYIGTMAPPARQFVERVTGGAAGLFGRYLNDQFGFYLVPFLAVFAGAAMIADDLRHGALLVYLSRPLTRRDYVAGKVLAVVTVLLTATLLPALVLYAIALSLETETYLALKLWWIGPAIVLHSLVISVFSALLILAISSIARSGRVAGLAFFALIVGLEIMRAIVRRAYETPYAVLLSPRACLAAVGEALFGMKETADVAWYGPASVLVLVAVGCLLLLRSRVRAVEVVA